MALALAQPDAARADTVVVFAAASLKNALDEVAARFELESGHDVRLSFAGSSSLARQIQHGAPADVFLSANTAWMDVLENDGLLAPETRVDLFGNTLVVIQHGADAPALSLEEPDDITARLGEGRLAMALLDAVPAGIYGRAALSALGLWDVVAARVAQTDNVRAALALVALGEAPLGLVYSSDAIAEPRVAVVAVIPPETHPPIVYPAAAIAERDRPAVRAFLAFMIAPAARRVFERHGFAVLSE